jgi:micrococcal nuclease
VKKPAYTYRAAIIRVLDGDTIEAEVSLGFDVMVRTKFRLYGIDTPEKTSKDAIVKSLANQASDYTKSFIGKDVTIESLGKDKYGRWLAIVHIETLNLNEELINRGLAKSYIGNSKDGLWETNTNKEIK